MFFFAILVLSGISLLFGSVIGVIFRNTKSNNELLEDKIDALLPQTQCGQCGYPGCRPYAKAIASNKAPINKCPPGGKHTMLKLAALLSKDPQELEKDDSKEEKIAYIDEINCIGCNKCVQVCPVDAIIGANGTMHTVLEKFCTGCNLCVDPCPTNCIKMKKKNKKLPIPVKVV